MPDTPTVDVPIPVEPDVAAVLGDARTRAAMGRLVSRALRPRFATAIPAARRTRILEVLRGEAVWFSPTERVADCRNPKDNKYLELALAAGAGAIVSGDADLLVLHPWRGVRILQPAAYLAEAGGQA